MSARGRRGEGVVKPIRLLTTMWMLPADGVCGEAAEIQGSAQNLGRTTRHRVIKIVPDFIDHRLRAIELRSPWRHGRVPLAVRGPWPRDQPGFQVARIRNQVNVDFLHAEVV